MDGNDPQHRGRRGPHLYVEERRSAELRVGRQDRRRRRPPRTACTATISPPRTARATSASAELQNIIIDTRPTPVQLTIDLSYFSPNGDGVKDTVTFGLNVPGDHGNREVVPRRRRTPRARHAGLSPAPSASPAPITWDGKDDKGAVLPEGAYKGQLSVLYVNGHDPTAGFPGRSRSS